MSKSLLHGQVWPSLFFSSGLFNMAVRLSLAAIASQVNWPYISCTIDPLMTTVVVSLLLIPPLVAPALSDRAARLAEMQQDPDPRRIVTVRGVRGDLWDWLYVESAKSRLPLGELLNVLLIDWQKHTESERQSAIARYRADAHAD